MSEIEKMKRYIKQTNMPHSAFRRYQMNWDDLSGLTQMREAFTDAVCLAFDYGMAKGYRAAKAEARRG